jgi:hypothetical protein
LINLLDSYNNNKEVKQDLVLKVKAKVKDKVNQELVVKAKVKDKVKQVAKHLAVLKAKVKVNL